MSFRADLVNAAREGVLLAVKWVIGLAIVALASQWVITDYLVTRARSARGEAAATYIEEVLKQQKAQAQAPKPQEAPR